MDVLPPVLLPVKAKVEVSVESLKTPVMTKGVPVVPDKVQVLPLASKVWLAAMVRILLTVIPPAPVAVVVVAPAPSPKVRLLNVQAVAPPKFPAVSTRNVPPVKLIAPFPVTSPPLTVRLEVPDKVPAVMVKSPGKTTADENDQPPLAPPLKVTVSKLAVPSSIAWLAAVAVKVVTCPPE